MTANAKNTKYFVVGGPVQPGRPCYIVRDSDAQLYQQLMDGEYCYVVAPYHMGKTSLMAHTADRMLAAGREVATVDLAQISSREVADDVGRWYYSLAYRIVRELRIRSDMQTWWQERSGLTNMQRLREFFLDVVLAETDDDVVILIDRIESALGQPFALQLLKAIRACYDARATEPEYRRLTFALLGSASVGQLVPSGHDSPFDVSREVELRDFDQAEVRQLVGGLACDQATADQVSVRLFYWTSGHPYLSQKILRALARRVGKPLSPATVDEVVGALFLTRNATAEEAHLSAIGGQLLRESPGKVARLTLYGKVRKGAEVVIDNTADIHRDLLRVGVLVPGPKRRHQVRNRVYREAFTAQWVNEHLPFGWKGFSTAAMVALLLVGVPFWYSQVLPESYIRNLTAPNQDYVTALESYRRLDFLPGFGDTADQLFSDYLARQSRRARRLVEVERFSEGLAEIPGASSLSEQILAEFWDRRTKASMHAGARDAALLFAARAMQIPNPERAARMGELLGYDFGMLTGTIRTPAPLQALQSDPESGLITGLDETHRIDVWQLTETEPRRIQRLDLLAEELVPLQRRLVYQGGADGKRIKLSYRTDHPRPSDIHVELRAPSGRKVTLQPPADASGEEISFDSRRDVGLRALLEENINGTWTAAFTDVLQGVSGQLIEWQVQIDGTAAVDAQGISPEPVAIPEPTVARQPASRLAPRGRHAMTWSSDADVRGDVLIWNVASGEVTGRIPRTEGFQSAEFALGHKAVLLLLNQSVELWDAELSTQLLRLPIGPALKPVLSDNGRYLVFDELVDDLQNELVVWDLQKLRPIGRLTTGGVAELVATDSRGELLAVSDGDQLIRLWRIRDGRLLGEFAHGTRPVSVRFDADAKWMATQDAAHTLRVWSVADSSPPALVRRASSPWALSLSADAVLLGTPGRGFSLVQLPSGATSGDTFQHGTVGDPGDASRHQALLTQDAQTAITYDGREALKFWRMTPLTANSEKPALAGHQAAIDAEGRRLAISSGSGDVRVLAINGGPLLLSNISRGPGFIGHRAPVTKVVFDASGTLVASGSSDGSVRIWDAATGAPRNFFVSHPDGEVRELSFAAGGALLVSANYRSVLVVDTQSGQLLAQTQIQADQPDLAVSADGERIYVAGDRGGLTRWNWRGDIKETLIAPDSLIRRVAIAGDEKSLVTADARRRLRVWDTDGMVPRERRERAAAAVDDMWLVNNGTVVVVQAGVWQHSFSVTTTGLLNRATRLIDTAPAAAAPSASGRELTVVTRQDTSTPMVRTVALDSVKADPGDAPGDRIPADVELSLALTLNEWGEPEPIYQR